MEQSNNYLAIQKRDPNSFTIQSKTFKVFYTNKSIH